MLREPQPVVAAAKLHNTFLKRCDKFLVQAAKSSYRAARPEPFRFSNAIGAGPVAPVRGGRLDNGDPGLRWLRLKQLRDRFFQLQLRHHHASEAHHLRGLLHFYQWCGHDQRGFAWQHHRPGERSVLVHISARIPRERHLLDRVLALFTYVAAAGTDHGDNRLIQFFTEGSNNLADHGPDVRANPVSKEAGAG